MWDHKDDEKFASFLLQKEPLKMHFYALYCIYAQNICFYSVFGCNELQECSAMRSF